MVGVRNRYQTFNLGNFRFLFGSIFRAFSATISKEFDISDMKCTRTGLIFLINIIFIASYQTF